MFFRVEIKTDCPLFKDRTGGARRHSALMSEIDDRKKLDPQNPEKIENEIRTKKKIIIE